MTARNFHQKWLLMKKTKSSRFFMPICSRKSREMQRDKSMDTKNSQNESLSWKADAAFRQAAKKVIQRAKETATPVVVWEADKVKEIPADQIETTMLAMENETARC